jgi:hypothetical protein
MLCRGRDADRLRSRAAQVEQPQVGPPPIGGEVGLAQLVDDPVSVRRRRRRGEAAEGGEIGGGDWARAGRNRCERQRGKAGEDELVHDRAP